MLRNLCDFPRGRISVQHFPKYFAPKKVFLAYRLSALMSPGNTWGVEILPDLGSEHLCLEPSSDVWPLCELSNGSLHFLICKMGSLSSLLCFCLVVRVMYMRSSNRVPGARTPSPLTYIQSWQQNYQRTPVLPPVVAAYVPPTP